MSVWGRLVRVSIVCKLYSVLLCPSFLFAHVCRRAWMLLPRSCEGEAPPSSVLSTLALVGVAFCASMPCSPATRAPCHVLPFRYPFAGPDPTGHSRRPCPLAWPVQGQHLTRPPLKGGGKPNDSPARFDPLPCVHSVPPSPCNVQQCPVIKNMLSLRG
jgi:hypothetical protein